MERSDVCNFFAGPAALPGEVIEKAQKDLYNYKGIGYSLIESSHRTSTFQEVIDQAEANVRELLGVPEDYAVLFLQGGASLQFPMVAMNLLLDGKPGLYADTGSWTNKAIKEAKMIGDTKVVFEGKDYDYQQIADFNDWDVVDDASYLYICSNNTIMGTQYHFFPEMEGVPLIADMSSDIMSRELDVSKFGMIFAGAQKNIGPAGTTMVIMRKDLAERAGDNVPTMLKYSTHIDKGSLFNTPPVFSIYMVGLVMEWMKEQGGLKAIEKINQEKARNLYEAIDSTEFYNGTAEAADRSLMNVTFRLPTEDLEKKFIKEAEAQGMIGLKGHRSVGGVRASIYNAVPMSAVSRLIDFMEDFEKDNS